MSATPANPSAPQPAQSPGKAAMPVMSEAIARAMAQMEASLAAQAAAREARAISGHLDQVGQQPQAGKPLRM